MPPVQAQTTAGVGLGTADNFAVLAGQGVTNTGPTTVAGDLGTSPNPSVTGAGLTVTDGTIHAADAVAAQAQADVGVAYDDAESRAATQVVTELGGQSLTAGAYDSASGTLGLTGSLTLDAQGDPNAVFVFQAASTLITASNSNVTLINGANACNVFWQVGSSATLGTTSVFRGTIMALASITVTTGVTVEGRLLARTGAVTLDTDTITRTACTTPDTTATTLASATNPSSEGTDVTLTATVTPTGGGTPTGTVEFLDTGVPIGTATLQTGTATLVATDLGPGDHPITAVYLGSPGYSSSTSAELSLVVEAPTVTPPTTNTTTTTTAAATPAPGAGANGGTPSTPTARGFTPTSGFPRTGTGTAAGAAIGALLIALGGHLVVGSRRTRRWRTRSTA
ncbi:MAG TPA: ice-binding family protein [Acidimicrobiales bacterium]|nr:ice-binding family protein [Acidimicrobiales bacterium]